MRFFIYKLESKTGALSRIHLAETDMMPLQYIQRYYLLMVLKKKDTAKLKDIEKKVVISRDQKVCWIEHDNGDTYSAFMTTRPISEQELKHFAYEPNDKLTPFCEESLEEKQRVINSIIKSFNHCFIKS